MLEAVVAGLLDEVKVLRDHKVKFLAGICFVQFILAIPMITQVCDNIKSSMLSLHGSFPYSICI